MTDLPDDRLDALLRDVAAPASLAALLKEITVPSDDDLDQLLCGVAMPEQLTMQLHAIPADELIDSELQDVQPPFTLRHAVQLATPAEKWRGVGHWLGRFAIAAVLFIAVSATFFTSTAAYLTSVYPPAPEPQWVVRVATPETWTAVQENGPPPEILGPEFMVSVVDPPRPQLAESVVEATLLDNWDESLQPARTLGAVAQYQALVRGGMRPLDDVVLMRWGLLGAPQYSEDDLPELVRVPMQARSGLELPLVPGYDRRFWLKEAIFPPINPQAHAKLQQLEIPLTTSTATLDSAVAALASGKLPNRDEVRVEHFVAGVDSRFPAAPRGQLSLYVQGSPSPFGQSDAYLLQLAVQAGKLRRQSSQPAHLVVAIDTSASMARGGRMEMIRAAVEQAHRQLAPQDALSLVAFEEAVVARAEHLRAEQTGELRQELFELLPRGGTNLAAGLQTAASVALTEPASPTGDTYRTRIVLITDSRAVMPDDTAEKIGEVLQLAGDSGVVLDVLDVSGRSEPDPLLAELTKQLGGSYRAISSRQQLFASLVEGLAGHNPAVASEAKVRIRFNTKAIAAYRLLGHEPNLLAQVVPAAVDAQLLPEECSSALFEVWFKPNAGSDLGQVTAIWKDPHTGARREVKTALTRGHFASSFAETPSTLQTAAVAAEIAEQLRGSREALRRENLLPTQARNNATSIRKVIAPWSLTLRQEPDLNRLLTVLDQMEKARGR